MARFRQSPILGYILAGVILGPSGYGLVSDRDAVEVLAEFGVLMLLFLVGMELDLRRFIAQWRIALLTTLIQIGGSVGVAFLASTVLGWSIGLSVLIGFVVALSSTAVVIKMLESTGELDSPAGRVTVAILIAQDMAVVPMMLVVTALAQDSFDPMDLGKVAFSVVFLLLFLWFLVKRQFRLPMGSLVAGNPDLAPLTGLAYCFGAATLSGLLDLSPAYGAFLAGVAIGNSAHSKAIIESTQPVQSVLMMVFFLSIGLLLDLSFLWTNLGTVLLLLLMVTVFKTALNIGAIKLLGQSWPTAVLAGASLAQIGEFSFLLAETGTASKLIAEHEAGLIVSVTVLSLVLSPFWMLTMRRLKTMAEEPESTLSSVFNGLYGREAGLVMRAYRKLRPAAVPAVAVPAVASPAVAAPQAEEKLDHA